VRKVYGSGGGGGRRSTSYTSQGGTAAGDGGAPGGDGVVNQGGGGGGGDSAPSSLSDSYNEDAGGAGGSGVVVVRYRTDPSATSVRIHNGYMMHLFENTGTSQGSTKVPGSSKLWKNLEFSKGWYLPKNTENVKIRQFTKSPGTFVLPWHVHVPGAGRGQIRRSDRGRRRRRRLQQRRRRRCRWRAIHAGRCVDSREMGAGRGRGRRRWWL